MITFFQRWMKQYLSIEKSDMRIQLHIYESMDIKKEEKFWLQKLGMRPKQQYKIQVRKLKPGSFSYNGTYGHGTCSLEHGSGAKKTKLMMAIKVLWTYMPGDFLI